MRCCDERSLGVYTCMLVYVRYKYIRSIMICIADPTEAMSSSTCHFRSFAAPWPLEATRC